jgi:hypothetical protein
MNLIPDLLPCPFRADMRGPVLVLALLFILWNAAGCTKNIPREDIPPPLVSESSFSRKG